MNGKYEMNTFKPAGLPLLIGSLPLDSHEDALILFLPTPLKSPCGYSFLFTLRKE